MAEEVKGILIRGEHLKGLQMLSDSQRGRLLIALFADCGSCEFPELDDMTKVVFELIVPSVRRANDAYEKRREANRNNGSKGGRPKKTEVITEEPNALTQKPIAFSVKSENPNEAKRSEANINEENTPHTPQGGRGAASEEYSDDFELFWHEYPNHNSGKKKAYTAFKRALKKVSLAELLKSLDEHKKSSQWTKDGGEYIPHATTWLNGERWTVEMGVLDDGREVDEDGIVWTGRKYLCKN